MNPVPLFSKQLYSLLNPSFHTQVPIEHIRITTILQLSIMYFPSDQNDMSGLSPYKSMSYLLQSTDTLAFDYNLERNYPIQNKNDIAHKLKRLDNHSASQLWRKDKNVTKSRDRSRGYQKLPIKQPSLITGQRNQSQMTHFMEFISKKTSRNIHLKQELDFHEISSTSYMKDYISSLSYISNFDCNTSNKNGMNSKINAQCTPTKDSSLDRHIVDDVEVTLCQSETTKLLYAPSSPFNDILQLPSTPSNYRLPLPDTPSNYGVEPPSTPSHGRLQDSNTPSNYRLPPHDTLSNYRLQPPSTPFNNRL